MQSIELTHLTQLTHLTLPIKRNAGLLKFALHLADPDRAPVLLANIASLRGVTPCCQAQVTRHDKTFVVWSFKWFRNV